MLVALDHRGRDGRDVLCRPTVVLGHQRFWKVPEEVGERQPLSDSRAGADLVFDGRLDNRAELAAALGLTAAEARERSDAALVLAAYGRWGERCFERLLGPFAVAVWDGRREHVVCARDAMGDRTLFYTLNRRALAIASEEAALLALPWVSDRLDEATLARFLAVEPPEPGATFFADLRELPPASVLVVGRGAERSFLHWQAEPRPALSRSSDAEHAERFREVLAESVRCRLRTLGPPAVMMSGGLDSTSVAALAATELAAAGRPPLVTVSWVFDELAACDERRYMDPLVERYRLRALRVPGDDAWPLSGVATWPHNPSTPLEGPYRRLRERVYAAARREGVTTILTGEYGDELYTGGEHWLADLLRQGRLATAGAELARDLWLHLRGQRQRYSIRNALGRVVRRRTPGIGTAPAPWLTPLAAGLAARAATMETVGPRQSLLDGTGARAVTVELFHASRAGVELRRPYRDRRLIELALATPAHQLYRPGRTKWILRRALAGVLPEPIRLRRRPTSLLPLAARGLLEREAATLAALLHSPDALWPRYVRPDWLARVPAERLRAGQDGAELVVSWLCLCLELWRSGRDAAARVRSPIALEASA